MQVTNTHYFDRYMYERRYRGIQLIGDKYCSTKLCYQLLKIIFQSGLEKNECMLYSKPKMYYQGAGANES